MISPKVCHDPATFDFGYPVPDDSLRRSTKMKARNAFARVAGRWGLRLEMGRIKDMEAEYHFVEPGRCSGAAAVAVRNRTSVEVTPCFTPKTLITTPSGERPVEELVVGDEVATRDNGTQPIRWIARKQMTGRDLAAATHLRPVLLRKGSLGNDLPACDMQVSPNHRMLVASNRTALYFEEREVLAAAKHLINNRGIHALTTTGTTYIHFMFDRHELVLANGSWTESFQPSDRSLRGLGNAQRNEILEIFPQLATTQGIDGYLSARRILSRREARRLMD